MRISERKQHLRARGIVPVSQEPGSRATATPSARARKETTTQATANKGTARPRRELSPKYQIWFGIAYIFFSIILILQDLALQANPNPKYHPGLYGLILPLLFIAFGAWQLSRGLKARRLKALQAAGVVTEQPAKEAPAPKKARVVKPSH